MTWERLAYKEIEGSASSTIDTGDFSAKGYRNTLKIIIHIKDDGANANCTLQCNSFTGAGYSYKYSENGDFTDGTGNINKNQIRLYKTGSGTDVVRDMTLTISNVLNRVKIMYGHIMESTGTGSNSNTLDRVEVAAGWEENPRIKSFQVKNTGSNNFAVGSYIVVYGSIDGESTTETIDEKDALTNIPAGTRYEETDTRKIYRSVGDTVATFNHDFANGLSPLTIDSYSSSYISVTGGILDCNFPYASGNSQRNYGVSARYDFGADTISETNWVLRWKAKCNSFENSGVQFQVGLTDGDATVYSTATQTSIACLWQENNSVMLAQGNASSNGLNGADRTATGTTLSNSTYYYFEMKRLAANSVGLKIGTSAYGGTEKETSHIQHHHQLTI